MDSKIFKTINNIDKKQWNYLVASCDIQSKYEYLKAIEESHINNQKNRYIVIFDDEKLVCGIPIFIDNNFFLDSTCSGKIKQFTERIRRVLPNFLRCKAIFVGCCVSEYNKVNIRNGAAKDRCVKLILEEVRKLSKEEKINLIIFKDFIEINQYDNFYKEKYFQVDSLPGTFINTNFDTFNDYLLNLKIKYRQNIRNKINKQKKVGKVSLEVVDDFSEYIDRIYDLYISTYNKAPNKFEKLEKNFFANINKEMGEQSKMILARADGKIIGYSLILCSKDVCINVRTGLDYSVNRKYLTYFLLHYYNINYAIEHKMKKLYLSQTSYRVKMELGAELVPLQLKIRNYNFIKNIIYKYMFKFCSRRYKQLNSSENVHKDLKKLYANSF